MAAPPPYTPVDPLAPGPRSSSAGYGVAPAASEAGLLVVKVTIGALDLCGFAIPRDDVAAMITQLKRVYSEHSACACWKDVEFVYGDVRATIQHRSTSRDTAAIAVRAAKLVAKSPPAAVLRIKIRVQMMTIDVHDGYARLAARHAFEGRAVQAAYICVDYMVVRLERILKGRSPVAVRLVFPPGVHDFAPAIPVGDRGLAEALAELLVLPSAKSAHWVDIDLVAAEDAAPGF